MILFYNILQLLLSPVLILLLPFYLMRNPGKLNQLKARLGLGLFPAVKKNAGRPTIWVHALSVGEVTSARALVQALRSEFPHATLIFSSTTSSGRVLADSLVSPFVDTLVPFPLDIRPVINRFMERIKPDLFILVETDIWPNFISCCSARSIPALLVNGRISIKSMQLYQRYSFFFRPLFNRFALISMQTRQDTGKMQQLGVAPTKLKTLGNLKFAPPDHHSQHNSCTPIKKTAGQLTIICGSTHEGEEIPLLESYRNLRKKGYQLHLVIAPRQVNRSEAISELAQSAGFSSERYSTSAEAQSDITIVDTLGDLVSLYGSADITFIGGSLVPEGGHNPLEAARYGSPLLFGPFMEDFSEISGALLEIGAAFEVTDQASFEQTIERLVTSEKLRRDTGKRGKTFTEQQHHVIPAHLTIIKQFM